MKTILVTGGAGFIGSNFIIYILNKYKDYKVINVDFLTYAGNLSYLDTVKDNSNYKFIQANICDRDAIDAIFSSFDIDVIVNFAAESHVDRSIDEPEVFLTTNIIGTHVLLDVAKRHWKIEPNNKYCVKFKEGTKFLQVSTDEVYGTLRNDDMFTETTPLMPNSPYSASKASADLIVRSYHETYGMPVNISRCSNNYGPHQFPEKLIPLMIQKCIRNESLPVYGDGMQIRDWLHVSDHCSALDLIIHEGVIGEVYNIGGSAEKTNIEIVKLILRTLNLGDELISYVEDRLGHDRRYAVDTTKIRTQLGWKPRVEFEEGLKETIKWYL